MSDHLNGIQEDLEGVGATLFLESRDKMLNEIRDRFSGNGCPVKTVQTEKEALNFVADHPTGLVVFSLAHAAPDGLAFFDALRGHGNAVTGVLMAGLPRTGTNPGKIPPHRFIGLNHIMAKPVDPKRIVE